MSSLAAMKRSAWSCSGYENSSYWPSPRKYDGVLPIFWHARLLLGEWLFRAAGTI
jgi:hypothetical protein